MLSTNPAVAVTVPYFTAAEAAAYVRVSTTLLAIMRMKGTGPRCRYFNTRVRYRKEDLDAYMEAKGAPRRGSPNAGRPPGRAKRARKAGRR